MACIARETYEHGNSLTTSEQTLRGSRDAEMPIVVKIRWDNTTHPERRGKPIANTLDNKRQLN